MMINEECVNNFASTSALYSQTLDTAVFGRKIQISSVPVENRVTWPLHKN